MKRILVAILFLSILMQSTPLKEIGKLPTLFQHFAKHKKENKTITFFAFLELHYFNGDPLDEDHDEDMKLPFKIINFDNSIVFSNTNNLVNIPFEKNHFYIEEKVFNSTYSLQLTSTHLANIWQPPKAC